MSIIRIQEFSGDDDRNAKIIFDNSTEYPITIHNPFSEKEEKLLEWYFEEHLEHPYTDEELAKQAVNSIKYYGESLFNQIFSDSKVYAQYENSIKNGVETVRFEIVGSPSFHTIHWEALKDPSLSKPFSLETSMVRKNIKPPPDSYTLQPSSTLNILLVTPRPYKHHDVGYRTISRPLIELIEQSELQVKIDLLRPRTYEALVAHLSKMRKENNGQRYYHILHFDTHGVILDYDSLRQRIQDEHEISQELFQKRCRGKDIENYDGFKAFIFFEDVDEGKADYVEAGELADLLNSHQIPIVVLNACQSGKQLGTSETSIGSYLIQAGTQLVVAMSYSITVNAAKVLMEKLYRNFFDGDDCLTAILSGRLELFNKKGRRAYYNQEIDLEDWLLPVVYQNQDVDLRLREFTPEERAEYYSKRADAYPFPTPEFGFLGRDIDILAIEDLLFRKDDNRRRNIVMIRGLGGAGKTTLLKHLGAWWQKTRFVDEVLYFGYDVGAWTCNRIMDNIAKKLLGNVRYHTEFVPMNSVAQQQMVVEILRSKPHLLILDNFESVTGDVTTTQHALPQDEQEALRTFLTKLAGGKTCIIIGTRGREDWLICPGAGGPLRPDDIYDLPGLDPEAASMLADRILERDKIDNGYRKDPNLATILKLLDGYPMAMEVILPNLKDRKPAEVLDGLKKGDITLDKKGATGRTESLIHSVEYSFGNLSEDQQDMLLCLAPFNSVIFGSVLKIYMERLRKHPAMFQFQFDSLQATISEATDWGLLRQHDRQLDILKLQPILSFYLRNRLKEEKYREIQDAINTTFVNVYRVVGSVFCELIGSKEAYTHKSGIFLVDLEYENLFSALNLALEMRGSIADIYEPISEYLNARNRNIQGLALGEYILNVLQTYPVEDLDEQIEIEIFDIIYDIGKRQFFLKKLEDSRKSYELVLKTLNGFQNISDEEKVSLSAAIYRPLGYVAQEQRKWEQAEKYYKKALEIEIELDDHNNQAKTYRHLGAVAQEQRQGEKAEQYCMKALEICEDFNDRYELASAYDQLGTVAKKQRQWEKAEQYYKKTLEIYIELDDQNEQAETYRNLGIVAQKQQQLEQAEQYYKKALEIYIEFDDRFEQAGTYRDLGTVAQKKQQWEQAEQYYKKTLEDYIEFDDRFEQAGIYRDLGTVAQKKQQWEQAEQYYKKTLEIFEEFNEHLFQAQPYDKLGEIAEEQQQWDKAEEYHKKALEIFEEFNEHLSQAPIYCLLGIAAEEQQQREKAEEYYREALEIFEEFNYRCGQAFAYYQLGNIVLEQQKWEQAEEYYRKTLEIFKESDNHDFQASTYHQMGDVAQEQRKWEQAEKYFKKALEIFEEFNENHSQAPIYGQLGIVAQEQQQWKQAEKYFKKALEIFEEFNDHCEQALIYGQLGTVARDQQQWKQAEKYYKKALEIFEESNDHCEQALIYGQLGTVAQDQQQWDQAEKYYKKALEIFEEFNEQYEQAATYHNLGVVAEEQQQWEQAEQYYKKALEILEELNEQYEQAATYRNLGVIAGKQQQWEQAEQYYKKALEIFKEFKDTQSAEVTLQNFSWLWKETRKDTIIQTVAEILGISFNKAKKMLK